MTRRATDLISRVVVAAIFLAAASATAQTTVSGLVVGVTDGDTLTLLDDSKQQHRIRLDGIDAPESGQPGAEPRTRTQGARALWPAGQPWRIGAESV